MDLPSVSSGTISLLWWLVPLALLVGFLKSPQFKGKLGESMVKLAAKLRLPSDVYFPFHNVTLPTADGTTQIDHIFVSRYGVFVVETKHMKGWIFGGEHQAQWTQRIFKQSFRFQNPLRQNYAHTQVLQKLLDLPDGAIHSVVVFTGECTFKSQMPANVGYSGEYVSYIKSFQSPVLSPAQVRQVTALIQSGRLAPTRETHRRHVEGLKARASPLGKRVCSRCGSDMVLRTARKGPTAGSQFWGCSSYPRCRAVESLIA